MEWFGLKCLLHMCGGTVVSEWNDDGVLWMAWQCARCGVVKHAEPAYPEIRRPAGLAPRGPLR